MWIKIKRFNAYPQYTLGVDYILIANEIFYGYCNCGFGGSLSELSEDPGIGGNIDMKEF
tara:strand:- start:115 stop:291 length:177 start_codon:yes stop_codon:yes gene_type:complete